MKNIKYQFGGAEFFLLFIIFFFAIFGYYMYGIISSSKSDYLYTKCNEFSKEFYYHFDNKIPSDLSPKEAFNIKLEMAPHLNDYRELLAYWDSLRNKNQVSDEDLRIISDHIDKKFCKPYWDYKEKIIPVLENR